MITLVQFKTTIPRVGNSIYRSALRCAFLLIPLVLVCFGLSPTVQAADGGLPNFNTAEGDNALGSLSTGQLNTAVGWYSLATVTTAGANTAIGAGALFNNNNSYNTAVGSQALFMNASGTNNTAVGTGALQNNVSGFQNSANGEAALFKNNNGDQNVANGQSALYNNISGGDNTANGAYALNLANGNFNTADGFAALLQATGSNNTAIGFEAGMNVTTGQSNIFIGDLGGPVVSHEISIGNQPPFGVGAYTACYIGGIFGQSGFGTAMPVLCFPNGKLATLPSSRTFKDGVKPMGQASEAILALKPVSFHYKKDPTGTPQFGLVAEEVEKVNPDLIVRDKEGKPYGVRYEQVNAMLLNEFLKEHKKTEKLEATVASLIATVKEQAAQIQKVSAQLEASKPAPQVVNNP